MGYLKKRKKAFGYAFKGAGNMMRREPHARIHIFAAILVIIAGWVFEISRMEWCVILLCIAGVLAAEGFNTAIEALADRITLEKDPLIGYAKDVAAGAVLIFAIISVIIGAIIFLPRIFGL